jgi:hypothetical protein
MQIPDYGTVLWSLAVELIPGNKAISAPTMTRDRELNLASAHRCSFLIMEQCCGPLPVEIVPGNNAISAHILPKGARVQSGAWQKGNFLIMEQSYGPLAVEIFKGKHVDFSTYLAKRARSQSGACAEVQFPDYGTKLWSPGSRNFSRKAGKHCDISTILS